MKEKFFLLFCILAAISSRLPLPKCPIQTDEPAIIDNDIMTEIEQQEANQDL